MPDGDDNYTQFKVNPGTSHTWSSGNVTTSNITSWTTGSGDPGHDSRRWCRCGQLVLVSRINAVLLKQLGHPVLCPTCLHKEAAVLKEKLTWTCGSGTPLA